MRAGIGFAAAAATATITAVGRALMGGA